MNLEWTSTPITQAGIVAYYEAVVKQQVEKKLAPRPQVLKADGSEGNFKACDYCPLKEICDNAETKYERWVSMVQSYVSNGNKEV
jgi:hypothetical protein